MLQFLNQFVNNCFTIIFMQIIILQAPKFQNSYKLDSDRPFNHEKVEQILQEVLEEALQDLTYDPDKCSKQAKWASSAIRAKVKEQEFDRYNCTIML